MPKLSAHNTLTSAANLSNLLPTGTVLAFQALMPSFSYDGTCARSNQYLTFGLIGFCAVTCFFSSFTDSFTWRNEKRDEKLYYGIATFKGLYIINNDDCNEDEKKEVERALTSYKICLKDFVHAFLSVFLFLVFSLSDSNMQSCFVPKADPNKKALIMNMPLVAGVLSGMVFTIYPTTRHGIGYLDMVPHEVAPQASAAPKTESSVHESGKGATAP